MISVVLRTIVLYLVVTVAIRLMGKRQIGDMQPNELVITLLISEIAAIPLQDSSQPLIVGITAIFLLIFLEITVSVLAMKSMFIRKLMSGKSVVIINNGVVDQKAMKSVRMTVLDLIELLRGQNIFDISQVAFAVLEVNGDLSVLLKTAEQPLAKKDAGIKNAQSDALPLPVISDGKIIAQSLNTLNIKKSQVQKMLNNKSVKIDGVFLMTLDKNGNANIIEKAEKQ